MSLSSTVWNWAGYGASFTMVAMGAAERIGASIDPWLKLIGALGALMLLLITIGVKLAELLKVRAEARAISERANRDYDDWKRAQTKGMP